MKHLLRISIVLALISVAGMAMLARSDADHTPRDHDRLHPGMANSRHLLLSVVDSTRTVLVNPEAASFDDARDASVYIDGDTISYVQFASKHRFILRSDTLSYIGCENRATDFRLDHPVRMAVLPFKNEKTMREQWSGHLLQYGSMMLRHAVGTSSSSVQSGWTLTDGTDTIRNATRLRWTLDMAYADPDSVDQAMPDSVASEMFSEMQVDVSAILSERLLTERSMWFTDDARYPILTDSRVSRILLDEAGLPKDTVPVSLFAMHYPYDCQYSDTGEGKPADESRGMEGLSLDPDMEGGTLAVGEPRSDGITISFSLSSSEDPAEATVTLYSDCGMRLTEPVTVSVGRVSRTCTLPVPAGWTGVSLLTVESKERTYVRKLMIKK